MWTKILAVSSLFTLSGVPATLASPVSFENISAGMSHEPGIEPRASGFAVIHADLNRDGVRERVGLLQFAGRGLNPLSGPGGGLEGSASGSYAPGDTLHERWQSSFGVTARAGVNAFETYTEFNAWPLPYRDVPLFINVVFIDYTPASDGFVSRFRLDLEGGHRIVCRLEAHIDPRFRSQEAMALPGSYNQLLSYFRLEGLQNLPDTYPSDFATITITGELVPAPGALALLGLGGLVAVRRRRTPV